MTRINVVPVEELTRQHLIAEYRELPRLFNCVRQAIARGEHPDDPRNPSEYCLGKGHVRFFYNKLNFIGLRFYELVREMKRRGYDPQFTEADLSGIPYRWQRGYTPTPEALALNRERINERLSNPTAKRTPAGGPSSD